MPFHLDNNIMPTLPRASQIDDPTKTTYIRILREEAEIDISFNITVSVAN
jgi:hypothetical protein